jgi:hypothetical protein
VDGDHLAITTARGEVNVYTILAEDRLGHLQVPDPHRVAFAPCGGVLAVGTASGEVLVQELTPGGQIARLAGGQKAVQALAFSHDGRLLAVLGEDGGLQLHDALTGREIARLAQPKEPIVWAGFEAGSTQLRGGTARGMVLGWTVPWPVAEEGRPLTEREREQAWADLGDEKAGMAWSALGRLLDDRGPMVAFVQTKWQCPAVDPASAQPRIAALVADLDDDNASRRDNASKALDQIGLPAEAALVQAYRDSPSLEARLRAKALLDRLEARRPADERRRRARSLHLLEVRATAEAGAILAELNVDERPGWVRAQVKAALARLARRGVALRRASR